MSIVNVAIVGVTGFTGIEALRVLLKHPFVKVVNLVGNSYAGKEIAEIYPALEQYSLPKIQKLEEVDFEIIDCVFCCLPHQTSQEVIAKIIDKNPTIKVVDLSADFRLPVELYEKVYGKHLAANLQEKSAYGLCEIFEKEVTKAQIVACPGCFPTSALLPLMPLQKHINGQIIIDSKTGISGAGRKDSFDFSFTQCTDSVKAYNPHKHRHRFEIENYLGKKVRFTPHLVPVNRGIETSIYFDSNVDCKSILQEFYKDAKFVYISGQIPATREVFATNFCKIYVSQEGSEVFISSVIDNIAKGSSMQAVQNMNILFGFPQESGLEFVPIIP
jgi:N-acetyl-gamma-glutamyl-phosphate reductase